MICGAVSVPNPMDPIMVPSVWYDLSIAHLRMVTRFVSMFSKVS